MSSDVVTVSLQLRWGDMDVNAHINNVAIARLFEESRVRAGMQLLRSAGALSAERTAPVTGSLVVARQEIEFLATIPYTSEDILGSVWISRVGRSSFEFSTLLEGTDGTRFAQGETSMVGVSADGGALPLPDDVADALRALLRPPLPMRSRAAARG